MTGDIHEIVNGPRETQSSLTDAERLLLLKLRQAGFDLVRDFLTGADGAPYEHARVIRRKGAA